MLKKFSDAVAKNDYYKAWLKDAWPYVTGALLLSVFQIVTLAVTGNPWGVSAAFADWGAWIYEAFGGSVSKWHYFASRRCSGKTRRRTASGSCNDPKRRSHFRRALRGPDRFGIQGQENQVSPAGRCRRSRWSYHGLRSADRPRVQYRRVLFRDRVPLGLRVGLRNRALYRRGDRQQDAGQVFHVTTLKGIKKNA
jgi:hypothetical protein